MKPSGIEWIGEIPEGWEVSSLKNLLVRIGNGAWGFDQQNDDHDIVCIRIADFDFENLCLKNQESFTIRNFTTSTIQKLLLQNGDILIEKSGGGDLTPVGRVVEFNLSINAVCSNFIEILRPKNSVNSKYLLNLLASCYHTGLTVKYIKQTTGIQNLDLTTFLDEKTTYCNYKEQQAIADYLDRKSELIDSTIEKQKTVIEKLKLYKQSVITEAVTKGLDPTVTMKPSGIEWIGDIPENWEVIRLRYIGSCQNGISKSSEFFGVGFPFVNYSDVYQNFVLPLNVSGLINSTIKERDTLSVLEGDVFFTRTSETIEEIGFTSTCLHTIDNGIFSGFLIRFRPNKNVLSKNFSKYYFCSQIHRLYFVKEMNLVTRASLSQELLKKMPILLPPLPEQQAIADYLDTKCSQIDTIIEQKQKLIEKLSSYKKSLIYECVTGKREVMAG